ncbi:MAG: hypothetical protein V1772_03835 [Chloroflexota bacterium]
MRAQATSRPRLGGAATRSLLIELLLGAGLLALAWWLRAVQDSAFVTWDEPAWVYRSVQFLAALRRREWGATLIVGHPGVTTMWGGALSLLWHRGTGAITAAQLAAVEALPAFEVHNTESLRLLGALLPYAKSVGRLAHAAMLVAAYALLRQRLARRYALAPALLLCLDPYHLALSRVLHLDALAGDWMLLCILSLALRARGRRYVALSGLCAGLAALTKTYALMIVPIAALALAAHATRAALTVRAAGSAPTRDALRRIARNLLAELALWAGGAALAFVLLWPAMWVRPLEALGSVLGLSLQYATAPGDATATFFRGRMGAAVGAGFYPVTMFFRATPLALVGLAVAAALGLARWRQRAPHPESALAGGLVAYAALYILLITLPEKKFDRYALPALMALNVAAGLGLASAASALTARLGRRASALLGAAPLGLVVAQAALLLAPLYPGYYVSYYNPGAGGPRAALAAVPVGWGEGLEQMATFLAAQPRASELTVATWGVASLAPHFPGRIVTPTAAHLPDADYVLLYISDIQGDAPLGQLLDDGQQPAHVVAVGGVEYAWLYRNRYGDALAARIGQTYAPGDVVVARAPTAFARAYGERYAFAQIGGADEAQVAAQLQTALPAHGDDRQAFVVELAGDESGRELLRRQLAQSGLFLWREPFVYGTLSCYLVGSGATFGAVAADTPSNARVGQALRLSAYGIGARQVQYRQEVGVALALETLAPVGEDLHLFLHLVDQRGIKWGQRDLALHDDHLRRTGAWAPGSAHLCHASIPLEPGIVPGEYALIAGLYRLGDLSRLEVRPADGGPARTDLPLGAITVAPARVPPDVAALTIPRRVAAPQEGAASPEGTIELLGYGLRDPQTRPGDEVELTLWWRCRAPVGGRYLLSVRLEGQAAAIAIPPSDPAGAGYPTDRWRPGEVLRHAALLQVPQDAAGGSYQLMLNLHAADGGQPLWSQDLALAPLRIAPQERILQRPPMGATLEVRLGEAIRLLGYDLATRTARPGDAVGLTLLWGAEAPPAQSYAVFVHVLDAQGVIRGQIDREPVGGARPTRGWAAGEYLLDAYRLPVSAAAPPGLYRVAVGMYDPLTGERLVPVDAQGQPLAERRILLPDTLEVAAPSR